MKRYQKEEEERETENFIILTIMTIIIIIIIDIQIFYLLNKEEEKRIKWKREEKFMNRAFIFDFCAVSWSAPFCILFHDFFGLCKLHTKTKKSARENTK